MTALYTPLPPTALYEVAMDIEDTQTIAERHGIDPFVFETTLAQPSVAQRVNQLRGELKSNGAIFRAQAAAVAEEMLKEVYKKAIDPEAGFAVKMDLLKYASKLADLEPKPNAQIQAGPGFSVTINIPQVGLQPKRVIDLGGNVVDASSIIPEEDPLAALPAFLRNRSATTNIDLTELPDEC